MNRLILVLTVLIGLLGLAGAASAQSSNSKCGPHGVLESAGYVDEQCLCLPGFGGPSCEKPVEPECGGNGVRENNKCVCLADFTGANCDTRQAPRDCSGQGVIEHPDDPKKRACHCVPGYGGDQCQFLESVQCDGHGVVPVSGPLKNQCLCQSGYGGEHCETAVAQRPDFHPSSCGEHGILSGRCYCLAGYILQRRKTAAAK